MTNISATFKTKQFNGIIKNISTHHFQLSAYKRKLMAILEILRGEKVWFVVITGGAKSKHFWMEVILKKTGNPPRTTEDEFGLYLGGWYADSTVLLFLH